MPEDYYGLLPEEAGLLQALLAGEQGLPTAQPVVAVPADGEQRLPTAQPVVQTALLPEGYAERAGQNALRAYEQARSASFGARGELSKYLDAIDPTTAFDYSPEAARYLLDVGRFPMENTQYDLTPSNLMRVDPQTGAPLPYTSGQLEQFAQTPLADQFYANFNFGGRDKPWDVGTLQFAPNQQYRLTDRNTGEVVYSGTGYEAGQNISQMANQLFEQKGQGANWIVEEAAPGSNEWTQRYEHRPDSNTALYALLAAMAAATGGSLLLGQGALGAGGAAASGAAGAGAGTAAGTAAGTTAALGGTAAAAPTLAAAAPAFGGITVVGAPAAGIGAALAPAAIGAGTLGAALAAAQPGPVNYGDQVYDQPTQDIVVEGARPITPPVTPPPLSLGDIATLPAAATLAPNTSNITEPSTLKPGEDNLLRDIMRYYSLGSGVLDAFGVGQGGGAGGAGMGAPYTSQLGVLPTFTRGAFTPFQGDYETYGQGPEFNFFGGAQTNG